MDRRDALRLLSLSTLAVLALPAMTACGDGAGSPRRAVDGLDLVVAGVDREPGDDAAVPDVVAALHRSGGALFGALLADAGDEPNLAFSPYSALVALAMVTNGARGRTHRELLRLFPGLDIDHVDSGLNALTAAVEGLAGSVRRADGSAAAIDLAAANALFGQQGEPWEQPFLDTLARSFGAGMQTVDFAAHTEQARAAINAWTAERTHDRIRELVPDRVLDMLTRLVAVNTLYLKAPWEKPFEKALTQPGAFTRADGRKVQTPMMSSGGPIPAGYARSDGWTAVRLPYAGSTLAMTVVLPDAGRFDDVVGDVTAGGLARMLHRARESEVAVRMPSFSFRSAVGLMPALKSLGVEVPFTDGADFSGMTTREQLSISAVLQQVFLAVDEDGTEAAAATAVVMTTESAPLAPLSVDVDRPFLLVIHDLDHGTPLFLARIGDPTA